MWDSSELTVGGAAREHALAAARRLGATLAAEGTGARSSARGPGSGARLATVADSVTARGTLLALAPSLAMLDAPSTKYPVYIDPSFDFDTPTTKEQHFDPVQSECPGSHYDDSTDYWESPVGYDAWGGECATNDTDYALYQVALPSEVLEADTNLIAATLQINETFSSACGSYAYPVTATWIGNLQSSTGWPGPAPSSGNVDSTVSVPTDAGSCSTQGSGTVGVGFNVLGDLDNIASGTSITFRLWENFGCTANVGSGCPTGDEMYHKQFSDNPDIQIVYNDTPNQPSDLEVSGNSESAVACATSPTSPDLPAVGKTASTDGPFLTGTFTDDDGDTVQGTDDYWDQSSGGAHHTASTGSAVSGRATAQIPASFVTGLANGTVIGWRAEASDAGGTYGGKQYGPYTSTWSPDCYFAVYPTKPDPPQLTPNFTQSTPQAVDSQISFKITQTSGDTAKEFVWELDAQPPTTSPPADEICSATSTTCKLSGGSATLTIIVPSPGPHLLYVYEQDTGGNDSSPTTGDTSSTATFTGAGDPSVSFTSESTLAGNFADALKNGSAYDNKMISTEAGAPGGADADGGGSAFDEKALAAAGWGPGKTVTVDGANFTLPDFGSSTSGADNLLAANQTIGTGNSTAGVQASAVVFLATSTYGVVATPGLPGVQNSTLADDYTVPAVGSGTGVTGAGCNTPGSTLAGCAVASGTISYGTGCGLSGISYDLTVPDWVSGPSDVAAVSMTDRDTALGQQADTPKIYAFVVPTFCPVTAVTLPDVGARLSYSLGGSSHMLPGLHIVGIALRDTTGSTPVQPTVASPVTTPCPAGCALPTGEGWTGAFASPVEDAWTAPSGDSYGNQTARVDFSPNIDVPADTTQVRIRLSDPGFLSGDGTGPLSIGAATIAQSYLGSTAAAAPTPLTFGGGDSVTIPEGGDVYSDPVTLPFAMQIGQPVLISLWIKNSPLAQLPENSFASGAITYFSAQGSGDHTADVAGTAFGATGSFWVAAVPALTEVDVTTTNGSEVQPGGEPTTVVVAANAIDGFTTTNTPVDWNYPSQRLAGELASLNLVNGGGVVDAGIEANRVLADSSPGGVSLLARLDRDVLSEAGVGTVVMGQGLEDLLQKASAGSLDTGLQTLESELTAFGVNSTFGTLTPCAGYTGGSKADACTTGTGSIDAARQSVNTFMTALGGQSCGTDFSGAVAAAGTNPAQLQSTFSYGYPSSTVDHVNLNGAGWQAIAEASQSCGFPADNPAIAAALYSPSS